MAETSIEWTERTWNPVTGCDRVSPGCAHCYALTLAGRLKVMGQARYQNDGGKSSGPGFAVTLHPDKLNEPLKRRKPTTYFVNSMSDLFHEEIPDEYIAQVFAVMAAAAQHTFQVLTKRPERMQALLSQTGWWWGAENAASTFFQRDPLPNVWLGVSIENRRFVHRADVLRETPAPVRFISAEPLLGPLTCGGGFFARGADGYYHVDWPDGYIGDTLDLDGIDWLIVGGESGPGHRPMNHEWARDLRDAAQASGTALFVKQFGGARPGTRLEDLPEDLRVRQFPTRSEAR